MARAYQQSDYADTAMEPGSGDWQALRGELVALLDQVESRFGAASPSTSGISGLSHRVRHLRDQVNAPETSTRHREALRNVKRAVDRFNPADDDADDLNAAIAEIRGRQGPSTISAIDRRPADMPEFRELTGLVSGIGDRIGRLEGQLRNARNSSSDVHEVASQVEQLTQVVELLAGAVGETGQVKRLESQIAALASMMSQAPKVDLSAVNQRLDDVSNTVAKLAELQAQQMEREIVREDRAEAAPKGKIEPAMLSIETNVRNVYDRIDAIERNMSVSSGEFERVTSEMASVTQALRDMSGSPELLVSRVEALAQSIRAVDGNSDDVLALKADISALQQSVLKSMEPRFLRLESQIEALSHKVVPVDTSAVEGQLKRLMSRMDEAGQQLDGLARLYHDAGERPDFESLATMVAERMSDAMSRKAAAPVAMFGPESLKTIEDRISSLVRSVSKGPDAETLASLVAEKTSAAFVKSGTAPIAAFNPEGFDALEKRMVAVFNTAGKDTAERLARLEATLASRNADAAPTRAAAVGPAPQPARTAAPEEDALPARLDSILSSLNGRSRTDTMPSNPGDDAPLIDRGFPPAPPAPKAAAPAPRPAAPPEPVRETRAAVQPAFDPEKVERPPRPQSSFSRAEKESFASAQRAEAAPAVEAPVSNTSTFVAAARRAQRARHEEVATETGVASSLISRAMARVRPQAKLADDAEQPAPASKAEKRPARKAAPIVAPTVDTEDTGAIQPGFLTRNRRPLLLAAALLAVSMLTLNLVLQRMQSEPAPSAPAETPAVSENAPGTIPVSPVPSEQVSSLTAPRVIDMVDATSVGSINPGERMAFARAPEVTPMPPTLFAEETTGTASDALKATIEDANPVIGAIAPAAAVETFALPPEALGPEPLRQAAADGNARAQFEVAAIYTEGQSVPANPEEAAVWYERSAAQGFAPAQYRLGNLYEAGTGVEKDLEIARLWYQRAAEAGNRMAMHNLAALYASGSLGEQKFEPAAEWFTKAAERGMTDSQFNLGMLYARGLGVEQDFEQSFKWFSLAAKSGDADAAKARDDIAKSLTADAVSRIGAEVAAWTSEPIQLDVNFAPIGTWMENFDPGETITTKDVVSRVQQALNKLGFAVGTPDGVAGPKTAEAIRTFERGTGMGESGKVNPRLLAVLGSQPV